MTDIAGITGYYLTDPTGNITVLAEKENCRSVPSELPEIAGRLMAAEPAAEQVGFLSEGLGAADLSLTMAGGEFCGNATLSAAAVFMYRRGNDFPAGSEQTVTVAASGADHVLRVRLRRLGESEFEGTVGMPEAESVTEEQFSSEGETFCLPVVRFRGITHLICGPDAGRLYTDNGFAERAAERWCSGLNTDALGIMRLDISESLLVPLVYVRSVGTMFWESSCASGTSACGAYLAAASGKRMSVSFREPAGILTVDADPDGEILLTGKVSVKKEVVLNRNSF